MHLREVDRELEYQDGIKHEQCEISDHLTPHPQTITRVLKLCMQSFYCPARGGTGGISAFKVDLTHLSADLKVFRVGICTFKEKCK